MIKCKPMALSFLLAVALTGVALGQGLISLDGVDGLYGVDTLNVNQTITFHIRLNNNSEANITGSTNGFRVYSPSAAVWDTTISAVTGAITSDMYDGGFYVNEFSTDGMGADTVGFGGFKLFKPGIPAGFNEVIATIDIGPIDAAYHKGEICLDSSFVQPASIWKWSTTAGDMYPDWDGPHCFTIFDPEAPEENLPPVLEIVEDQEVDEGATLAFGVVATDPDATIPVLSMTSLNLPPAAVFVDDGDGTGSFNWTPGYFDAGVYSAVIYAVDAEDAALYDSAAIGITVYDVNRPPVIEALSGPPPVIAEGDTVWFSVAASDPDETIPDIFAHLEGEGFLAPNMSVDSTYIDAGNMRRVTVLMFAPDYNQGGFPDPELYNVVFEACDEDYPEVCTELAPTTFSVANTNRPPVVDPVADQEVHAGDNLSFGVAASDPDGDTPAVIAENLPVTASFTDNGNGTGTFDWTPDIGDIGDYAVRIIAVDDFAAADTQMVSVTVTPPNRPPEIAPIDDITISECDVLDVTFTATDPDDDPLLLWLEPLVANMMFTDNGDGSGDFDFAPSLLQEGTYPLTLYASDGEFTSSVSFSIIVENCETGFIADVMIEPDFIFAFYAFGIEPMLGSVYFGNLTDAHSVADIDASSLRINGTISQVSTQVLPNMEGFDGEVLEIEFLMSEFIATYGAFLDTTAEIYSVSGEFTDAAPIYVEGGVTLRGPIRGDVNLDGTLDISDITYLVAYIFGGGPAPRSLLTADMDESGFIDVSDLADLIEKVF